MQTYTHALIGGALGAMIFDSVPKQVVLIVGSVLPDLVMVPLFILDKIKGRKALAEQGYLTRNSKEISHSLPLSLFCLLSTGLFSWNTYTDLLAVFFMAMATHIVMDGLTHCGEKYKTTDQSCLWPWKSPKLGSICGIWEYRYDHGVLKPKPLELLICVIATLIWIFSVFS